IVNYTYIKSPEPESEPSPSLVMFGELIGMIRYIESCLDNGLRIEIESLGTRWGKPHARLIAKCPAEIGTEKVIKEVYKKWDEIYFEGNKYTKASGLSEDGIRKLKERNALRKERRYQKMTENEKLENKEYLKNRKEEVALL